MSQRSDEENLRRFNAVVDWCKKFGEVRRVERKDNGTVHIHWKEWEVADMVSFA